MVLDHIERVKEREKKRAHLVAYLDLCWLPYGILLTSPPPPPPADWLVYMSMAIYSFSGQSISMSTTISVVGVSFVQLFSAYDLQSH